MKLFRREFLGQKKIILFCKLKAPFWMGARAKVPADPMLIKTIQVLIVRN